MGMTRAWMMAGARAVIATQWSTRTMSVYSSAVFTGSFSVR